MEPSDVKGPEDISEWSMLFRLIIAMLLAGVLGWERGQHGKAAGLRTHMLVGMGSASFVFLGEIMVTRFAVYSDLMRFDPIRVIEAVITGISFLGAGLIFVSREERVHGLTTAAAILVTAAIGIAVGLERYILAVGSTALLYLVLRTLRYFEQRLMPPTDKTHPGPPF